ncbi:MAG: hypothetical protein K6A65_04980 [Succinivibrionaceae bacterium]|nr:hypothetical protein [Succinivibrionaceae bacterium]
MDFLEGAKVTDFIVNESEFVLDMEGGQERFLGEGEMFPEGSRVGELIDSAAEWQLYYTEDGRFQVLAVAERIGSRWVNDGYLSAAALMPWQSGERNLWLLFSPTELALDRVNGMRLTGKTRRALEFIAAVQRTRTLDAGVNLRDGFFCELWSVVLPTFSLTPEVADRALFENALRGKLDPENLSGRDAMPGQGLTYLTLNELREKGRFAPQDHAPWLQPGEPVDDFIRLRDPQAVVTGLACAREQYQIFATQGDERVLMLEEGWARELLSRGFLRLIDLRSVTVGGQRLRAYALGKRQALEPLDERHHGLTVRGALRLAQSIRRSRALAPTADLAHGLYSQALGLVLPTSFEGGSRDTDHDLMMRILSEGPFAMAAFMEDEMEDLALIASR